MKIRGYELVEELFVDNSGFGSPDEPAYTQSQFEEKLAALLNQYGQLTAKITDAGQFQVYIGLFTKTGKSICKKIANNTLEVNYGDKRTIRLHDTDILTFENNHVTLNNGGWETVTTKARMNQYLKDYDLYVSQKNYQWFVRNQKTNEITPYTNGMTLSI